MNALAYCTSCGTVAPPVRRSRGSVIVGLVLCLFFLVPGLIYFLWRATSKFDACERCGSPAIVPADAPIAVAALQREGRADAVKEYRAALESNTQAARIGRALALLCHPATVFRHGSRADRRKLVFLYVLIATLATAYMAAQWTSSDAGHAPATAATAPAASPVAAPPVTDAPKEEPCVAEGATAAARAAAQQWCTGGIFKSVAVSADGGTLVATLQLSTKGQSLWRERKYQVLNALRKVTQEVSTGSDSNVAISVHDASTGLLVGGCVKRAVADEPTCK